MPEMPKIDVRPDHWRIVRDILQKHVPQYAVWAFGSRARWTAKEYSDLDLAIITDKPLSLETSAALADDFSESDLPWKVDIVDWATTSESFREIIEKNKVVVQAPERRGGMGREWREVSLGELFKVKHGFAFKSEFFTDEPQNTVLVTPGNFAIGGGFQDSKRKYYKGQLPEGYVLKPGQIVVTMTDLSKESDTLGYAASIPDDSIIWLHNQRVGLLEFKPEIPVLPRFIEYLLRTHEYRSWIVGSATGTTVKHTSPGRIESFVTRIPSIEEQRAIAHILGTLDDKIELNRRINQTLEAMAQAIFKSWFVDFDPVKAKIVAIEQGQDPGRAAMRAISGKTDAELDQLPRDQYDQLATAAALFPEAMQDTELGEIPEGWKCEAIGSCFDLTMGQSPPSHTYNETGEGMPFYQGCTDFSARFPTRRVYCTKPTRLAEKGDVLVSVRAPVGDINVALDDCAIGRGVASVRYNHPSYALYVLHQKKPEFKRFESEGTVFGSINKKQFESLKFVLAPDELVRRFQLLVGSLDKNIESNELEMRSFASLRDILLPKLISGELTVAAMDQEVSI